MRKRSAQPGGPFHVQIIKGDLLSNALPNRLNDYKHQFPKRHLVTVHVLIVDEGDVGPDKVVYEALWEQAPK